MARSVVDVTWDRTQKVYLACLQLQGLLPVPVVIAALLIPSQGIAEIVESEPI